MRRERQMKLNQMKLSFSICASLIGFGVIPSMSVSLAQSGWFWQNPLPQGNSLNAVAVLDSDTVTVAGAAGTIVRTTDGGATWTQQTSGTNSWLYGVSLVDANIGTAVGFFATRFEYRGTIVRTTDGGATWTSQSGATTGLTAVAFLDPNTGTAAGYYGTMLLTTNGGATWTSQTSRTTNSLLGVSYVDANTGTAVGARGTIVRTTDGGATWTPQTNGTTNDLIGVSFADANIGAAVGSS